MYLTLTIRATCGCDLVTWRLCGRFGRLVFLCSSANAIALNTPGQALDTSTKLDDVVNPNDAPSVANVLISFLDSIPKALIPSTEHARCAQVTDREDAFEV